MDPVNKAFRQVQSFTINQNPDRTLTTTATPNGPFALIELTNALPRAQLFSSWIVDTDADHALTNYLANVQFDPTKTVIVHSDIAPANSTNANTGTVEFLSYSPREIELKTESDESGVLLLNDRFHPSWTVEVDGQPATLLKCNYLMRGVQLDAGSHTVTFKYAPKIGTLYVTLAAVICGLFLTGFLAVTSRSKESS